MSRSLPLHLLSAVGAIAGGAVGYFVFHTLYQYGLLGPFIPAGLLGVGCAALSVNRSNARGIACGIAGLLLGLYTDWMHFHWQDDSLRFYVTHLHWLPLYKWALLIVGSLLAYWVGRDAYGIVPAGLKAAK